MESMQSTFRSNETPHFRLQSQRFTDRAKDSNKKGFLFVNDEQSTYEAAKILAQRTIMTGEGEKSALMERRRNTMNKTYYF